jgi:hypothetical protein
MLRMFETLSRRRQRGISRATEHFLASSALLGGFLRAQGCAVERLPESAPLPRPPNDRGHSRASCAIAQEGDDREGDC